MTDSTAGVREALSRIVADEPDDSVDPATLDAIWRAGSRRRWRARAGVVGTLGVVAMLVLGALVPAPRSDGGGARDATGSSPWRATRNTSPCRGART